MVPVKIECLCGQHYAFDVEPIDGRTPSPLACPACGADGTAATNAQIVQHLAAQSTMLASPAALAPIGAVTSGQPANPVHPVSPAKPAKPAIRIATPAPAHAAQLGPLDRDKAETQTRAKVSWGDPPTAVVTYLMTQGFSHQEASDLVRVMFQERAAQTRIIGGRKIFVGSGMA